MQNTINGIILCNKAATVTENDLAFDHAEIIRTAITRLRNRIDYESDAFNLLKDKDRFTISELKRIYETIKNKPLDLPNFRKTFIRDYVSTGRVTELDETTLTRGRSARLYKFNQ